MDKCKKCGGHMKKSKYIQQTYTGIGDFHDNDQIVTISPGGSGKVAECMKCENCGWSVTSKRLQWAYKG